jgi:hypothetical protein
MDLDGNDDLTPGAQEDSASDGCYREHLYHRMLNFDGDTDQLLAAVR